MRVEELHVCEGCENNTCLINDQQREEGNVDLIKRDREVKRFQKSPVQELPQ